MSEIQNGGLSHAHLNVYNFTLQEINFARGGEGLQ
jgi:hypothetical protein